MKKTDDLRVLGYCKLMEPRVLKKELPISEKSIATVLSGRENVQNILSGKDKRLLVIVGPCSIHDEKAAIEYAKKLNELRKKVDKAFFVIMRVYFEKPRTTVGWKGLINDPQLDGTCNITDGLTKARRILLQITEMGLTAGTEMLEMVTPQYVADLVSWAAIGARTTESQTHREMASGLSMPVGFKNGTDGILTGAINAMVAARAPQSFLGIDQDGKTSIVKTSGNPWCHLVLRGGRRPNYDPVSIEDARMKLSAKGLPGAVMVDCSHANSGKKFQRQEHVWKDIVEQRLDGDDSLIGMMLESNLFEGTQKFTGNSDSLDYGVSITDECISMETTERLLLSANEKLAGRL
jgi:3-deoxy-7-phosphoheptulonate synthase